MPRTSSLAWKMKPYEKTCSTQCSTSAHVSTTLCLPVSFVKFFVASFVWTASLMVGLIDATTTHVLKTSTWIYPMTPYVENVSFGVLLVCAWVVGCWQVWLPITLASVLQMAQKQILTGRDLVVHSEVRRRICVFGIWTELTVYIGCVFLLVTVNKVEFVFSVCNLFHGRDRIGQYFEHGQTGLLSHERFNYRTGVCSFFFFCHLLDGICGKAFYSKCWKGEKVMPARRW